MAVLVRPPAHGASTPAPAGPGRPRLASGLGSLAVAAAGLGLVVLVARDGSSGWQVVRATVVAALAVGLWRVIRMRSVPWTAAVVFLAGSVVAPIGAGIAAPHAAKAGLTLTTAAGVLTLLGGALLLVTGGTGVLRRMRGWRRAPVAVALVATTAVAAWSIGFAVAATNVPRTDLGPATPADRGLTYASVEFPAADGVTLSGWYVPSANRAAVVLLHGAGSTRSSVLDHAVVLARHGYGVLLYDARGHGRSEGRAMDFGWYGDHDVAGAVAFLRARADVDPARIAAVGMSMGGEQAIGAAAADDAIRAVVAEGATNRVAADKAWLSGEYGWRGAVMEALAHVSYGVTDLLTAARPPIALRDAVARTAPRPFLLIAAGDVADEGHVARWLQQASPAVDVWVAPGAGHTDALRVHPAQWEQRVVAFLDRALGAGPADG